MEKLLTSTCQTVFSPECTHRKQHSKFPVSCVTIDFANMPAPFRVK